MNYFTDNKLDKSQAAFLNSLTTFKGSIQQLREQFNINEDDSEIMESLICLDYIDYIAFKGDKSYMEIINKTNLK